MATRQAPPASDLVVSLIAANDTTRKTARFPSFDRKNVPGSVGRGSVVRAALDGVATGEEWHEPVDGRCYIGGSYAMFIACCYLIRRNDYDLASAWAEAQEVNERYEPPFPVESGAGQTLKGRFKSAVRTLERAGELQRGSW